MQMEGSGSPPMYCFVLFYCPTLLAQFYKLSSHELWKIRLLIRPKRKKNTTNPRLWEPSTKKNWDSETQISPENKTLRPIKYASKISRSGIVFQGSILYTLTNTCICATLTSELSPMLEKSFHSYNNDIAKSHSI